MAAVWILNVSGARTCGLSSIEDKIWDEGTSVSATMGRALGAGRGVPEQPPCG